MRETSSTRQRSTLTLCSDAQTVTQASLLVISCEACCREDADFPFDWVLDHVTGRRGSETDYVLKAPAKCPNCGRDILEKTLVNPDWTDDASDSFQP